MRLHHEASLHEQSCFITLTYADEWVPEDYSVDPKVIQLFVKRLRSRLGYHQGKRIRFFACGEYGDLAKRPHYHLILFGHGFYEDRKLFKRSSSGELLYVSEELQKLWPFGWSTIGTVTIQSCGYVARYIMKKVTGDRAADFYERLNPITGEYRRVLPEFITMSKKPGLGSGWFDRFQRDAFPSDFIVVDGSRYPVPRYYLDKLKQQDEEKAALVVFKRKREALKPQRQENNTPERLATREESAKLKVQRLKRGHDDAS